MYKRQIFGGIVRCDLIAQGIIDAVEEIKVSIPMVIRLQGNKADEGKRLLNESGLNIIGEDSLQEASKKNRELSQMSVLIDNNTKAIFQGFTGSQATMHAEQCIDYGTNIIGGVTPGKGGQEHLNKPVFDSVKDACAFDEIDTSVIFVPAKFTKSAILEAAENGINLIICITEGVPVLDMI